MLDLTNDDVRTEELLDAPPRGVQSQAIWDRFSRKHVREMLELEQELARSEKRSERFEHVIKLALCEGYVSACVDLEQMFSKAVTHDWRPPWLPAAHVTNDDAPANGGQR